MKNLFVKFILLGFCLTSFFSCTSDKVANSTTSVVDIYVSGTKGNNPCYWKNNQLFLLDAGGFTNTTTRKIIVSNGDVYVLGLGQNPGLYSTDYVYLFWKNGVLTDLRNALSVSSILAEYITDMYIDGTDVYFCGTTKEWPNGNRSTVYWKNGVKTILSANDGFGFPGQMLVKNNSVYIISTKGISLQSKKGYYIDSVFYDYATDFLGLYGIYENNNNIYIYGTIDSTQTGSNYIGYYKNIVTGTETTIPSIQHIENLQIDSGNLYYANMNGLYCNNILLNNTHTGLMISGFYILNSDKYILSSTDDSTLSFFVDVNGVTTMQNASDEHFESLFVVQN